MKSPSVLRLLFAAVAAPATAASWKNVNIGGGGGFSPGIVFHPTAKGVGYLRTDIGGLYKLNADDSWTPLTDSIATDARWSNWGVDAVALDPQDPNKVYAAVGMYTNSWDPNPGAIIQSSDQGATWSSTDLPFKVGGNMPGRGMGERLAVDPNNSKILYFGARSGNGLWKSTDGGVTWAKVSSFTNVGTFRPDPSDVGGLGGDLIGLTFVTFDSTSGVTNGATSRIFVGTADNTTSVYVSSDAGATWTAVAGQPNRYFPHKCKLQPAEKALYLTYSDGAGPYDGASGAVYRYDLTAATWKDITPVSGSDLQFGFGGLGLDMQKPGTLMVASLNLWWPDAQFFRSTDSGATWSKIWEWASAPNQTWYYGLYTDNAPWINAGFVSQDTKRLGWMIEALEINPLDSNHWLYATGLTVYGGHDLTKWDTAARNVTISSLAVGIEEMAVLGLASPPGGSELLAAVADNSGFTFGSSSDLGTSPNTPWMTPIWSGSTDVDYAGSKPENVVRVGYSNSNNAPQIALSTDGGKTWKVHNGTDNTKSRGTLAYSAEADTILWSSGNAGVLRSQNQGTFTAVSAVPSGAVIAADRRNNTVFYAGSGSDLYRSTDSAVTFAKVTSALSSEVTAIKDIVAHPAVAGEVWVSTNVGLFRSTNYGSTFTRVGAAHFGRTERISFGKGEGPTWNVYAFGVGEAGAKLYASSDGATWVDIQGSQGFGSISACRVVGSGNVAGQVYVGTDGRGVFYAKVPGGGGSSSSSSAAPSSTSIKTTSMRTTLTTSTVKTSSSASAKTTTTTVKCRPRPSSA